MKTKTNNIPQAAEDVNVEAVKEMLPASPAVAVDNDEKYIPFLMIFAVQLIGSCISLINLGGYTAYTYKMQTPALAKAGYDKLAKRFAKALPQENLYTLSDTIFRIGYIYGVNLFEYNRKSILSLIDKSGNPVLSDEGDIGSLDADYAEISEQLLNGPYTSKKFLTLHKDCILSAHVNPSVEKTQRGVVIKTGKRLISFAPEDDVQRRADLFTRIVSVLKA
ncbi:MULTISPECIES: hypothetical protein [Phytobacter]|uniref:Uncharacterized protein n=1 Tax=Phytobacter diazotrophicus TaxID=395631 RepID=A0ABN6LMR1_9ENTR|nr:MULTISPECIES: hypothetical protein [Phytobacter]MDU4153667.1 hypothetical protein [Enterobacteriaceae bacterium]MDU7381494.1 hypothetical protein [Enterobacteriaceae bacterium]BBE77001.1 hypothetical protein MRY16398_20570 [Phytobacter sp. MRY16-398]BDD50466.1 hypothetical protein PDTA9734_19530 [Phytobacter diazotrophicus]BEG81495.1 hypothetical protein PDTA9730_19510 [Phytobacter diazotrophicus]